METLARKYRGRVDFLFVYCREAHPDGDPRVKTRTKKNEPIKQPKSIEERKRIARQFCADMKMSRRILVDGFTDSVQRKYGGRPNPTIVLDVDGKIALNMAWTNGKRLEAFLTPFLAGKGKFDAKLAAKFTTNDGPGFNRDTVARMVKNMLDGIDLMVDEEKATRAYLMSKMQARQNLRREAMSLERLARSERISDDELNKAIKDFEDRVARFQKTVAEQEKALRGKVSARAWARLLARGVVENGVGLMGPNYERFAPR